MHKEPINQNDEAGGRDSHGVLKHFRETLGRLTHGEVEGWNVEQAEKREEERMRERTSRL